MRALRSSDLLELWERAHACHPVDRALVVLAYGCADRSWAELCTLPIGERNRLLLELHESMFGPRLELVTPCTRCGEQVEFEFAFPVHEFAPGDARAIEIELDQGERLRLRLPDSRDLAAVVQTTDPLTARRQLIERCAEGGLPSKLADLDALAREFSAAIEQHDPLASIVFPMTCPDCGQAWRAALDPVDYVWRRLEQRIRAIVREVHALANAYGWTEGEVLRLSPARRRLYLQHVGA